MIPIFIGTGLLARPPFLPAAGMPKKEKMQHPDPALKKGIFTLAIIAIYNKLWGKLYRTAFIYLKLSHF
jgi:hypothetical protein